MSTQDSKLPAVLAMRAGAKPMAIVPQTFEECYRMAKLLAASGMVPDNYRDKPEACCVAVMQGLELGLSPVAAVNSIAVINGRPSVWGDGALAVVRASGLMESFKETDDGKEATCAIKRKDDTEPIVRKFSMDDAKRAGLAGKKGPWQDYPQRMRQMRARSWALRDGFADVLKGLYIAEEAQDIPMRDVTPSAGVLDVPDTVEAPAPEVLSEAEQSQDLPFPDQQGYLTHLGDELAAAATKDVFDEVWSAHLDSSDGRLSRESQAAAQDLHDKHVKKFGAS